MTASIAAEYKLLLSETELASKLGVPVNTVRRWRKTCGLPHIGVARRFFYRLPTVLSWLDSQQSAEKQFAQRQLPI